MDTRKCQTQTSSGTIDFEYPASYTVQSYVERYGETNVLIFLEDAEKAYYKSKAGQIGDNLAGESDISEHLTALFCDDNAWKPLDERPPTDLEVIVDDLMSRPEDQRIQLQGMIQKRVAEQTADIQIANAKDAQTAQEAMLEKFATPDEEVDAPDTTHETEPVLESFEEMAKANEELAEDPAYKEDIEPGADG